MLGIDGSKYLVELWAGDTPLDDYKMSPMNGDLEGLGHITLTVGTKETLYPDAVKFSHMLNDKGIKASVYPRLQFISYLSLISYPRASTLLEQLKNHCHKRVIIK